MNEREGSRRPGRPQAAPPAILRASFEPFEGLALVDELRSRTGVVLWHTLRNLRLWAGTPGALRPKLFAESASRRMQARLRKEDLPSALLDPLLLLSEVLRDGTRITEVQLAQASAKVSRWAAEQGLPQTAISFAQAAALLLPERADLSYQVGLLCRTSGQYARAETWFRRTIVLACRREDAHSYAMSWNSLGNLYMRRGQHRAAELAFIRALRKSRRSGVQLAKAMALHNLFCVAVETGRVKDAELYAQKAVNAYRSSDAMLIRLAYDVAGLWLSRGFHRRALPVFCAVIPLLQNAPERLHALAATARASAGAERKDIFTSVWIEAWGIIDQSPNVESAPAALVHLAHASAMLSDWERAELAGSCAVSFARVRNEKRIVEAAEEILTLVRERRLIDDHTAAPEISTDQSERSDLLAEKLVQKLSVCARKGVTCPRTDLKALA